MLQEVNISLLGLSECRTWINSYVDFTLYLLGKLGVKSCFIVFVSLEIGVGRMIHTEL